MKTDFQLWHYTEVSGGTHNPAVLPPGKDPKNAQNSRLEWAPQQKLQKKNSNPLH